MEAEEGAGLSVEAGAGGRLSVDVGESGRLTVEVGSCAKLSVEANWGRWMAVEVDMGGRLIVEVGGEYRDWLGEYKLLLFTDSGAIMLKLDAAGTEQETFLLIFRRFLVCI